MAANLTDAQKKARAAKMLEMKLMLGKTNEEIAVAFGVKRTTVSRAMTLAKKADIIVSFEDKLVNELLPLAFEAAKGALLEGNAKVALALLQGTQILRPNQTRSKAQESDDDELSKYIARKRAQAALDEDTVDAELALPHAQLALTSGSQAEDAPRGPEPSRPVEAEEAPEASPSAYSRTSAETDL